jgi:hypothetical protein
MAKNKITNSEDILIKADQNNLIYIDPNSVIDRNGGISPRNLQQENLVMYANLEADIVPRTILASGNDQTTLTSIAKGTLNFLKNQDGKDYDTKWTDSYVSNSNSDIFTKSDESGQSFGIDSINIQIKGFNAIPQVQINFIDVRGKTLFESPENSPYKAFFHIPWPIFYLTVKGYYGKAIRYRLHLVKFSTKYNESNGNFEVSTTFVGSTYAYLTDIPLQGIFNAPYMFPIESTKDTSTDGNTTLETVVRSTKGYSILKSIYNEYIQKGFIKPDFPVKTLSEVIMASHSIDKILEKEIFKDVDMRLFAGLKEYEEVIDNFVLAVRGWGRLNLESIKSDISTDKITYYGLSDKDKRNTKKVLGTGEDSLEFIIKRFKEKINSSKILTENLNNKTKSKFNKKTIGTGNVGEINNYYILDRNENVFVIIDSLVNNIYDIKRNFNEQREILTNDVEKTMNEIIKRKDSGFGFEPTIRNIFAIILANAETYIRLMKDVHDKAFSVGQIRKDKIYGFTKESVGEPIYPWPEIKINSDDKENVIVYPGDPTLIDKLESNNPQLWPEVDFIENYINVTTNRINPLSDKETNSGKINYIFNSNIDENSFKYISSLNNVVTNLPYSDKTHSNIIYEIWERAYTSTLVDSFDNNTLKELADIEFLNIKNAVEYDESIISLLKTYSTSLTSLKDLIYKIAPFEKYSYYEDNIPTTWYLKDFYTNSFKIEQYSEKSNSLNNDKNYESLSENLLNYRPELYRKDIYPFSSDLYSDYLNSTNGTTAGFTISDLQLNNTLNVNTKNGLISSKIDPKFWVKSNFYKTNIFAKPFKVDNYTSVHILNTPYFHKQLHSDFESGASSYGKYVGSAYILLNSLPFVDLDDKLETGFFGSTILASSIFREVSSSHYIPYHMMLKWGSIYHRYKKFLLDERDILNGFLTTGNTTTNISGKTFFDNDDPNPLTNIFEIDGEQVSFSNGVDIGIHPYYDAIFHQVVNGYQHYESESVSPNGSFENNVAAGAIKLRKRTTGSDKKLRYWTQYVDNSKFSGDIKQYTLLPSDGGNQYIDKKNKEGVQIGQDTFDIGTQIYNRVIWEDDFINSDFSGLTFSSPTEYIKTIDGTFGINTTYRKVFDLIATFSPSMLEEFENEFLRFASEVDEVNTPTQTYSDVKYYTFQSLLKELVTVEKKTDDSTDINQMVKDLKTRQVEKIKSVSNDILSNSNLLKITIGNPKEIDPYIFHGFADINDVNKFTTDSYNSSDLNNDTRNLIKLYVGEEPISGTTTTYYTDFFSVNNIKLTEENILTFRPLILIYAGYIKAGGTNTKTSFQTYIKNNIFIKGSDLNSGVGGSENRLNIFLERLLPQLSTLISDNTINRLSITDGYNNRPMKTELYNFFKSFNDKWSAGNSIGQRNLMEEFLFLDKSNKDIGDQYYFNITRLKDLGDEKNLKQNLYSAISILIQGTGFDMKALPAYVNFYGTNFSNNSKITPSKKVAENIFGTFLDVDYQESSPKIIIQYVSSLSKRPDMPDKNKYKFSDDSFNIGNVNNNPVLYTLPKVFKIGDLAKSNKAVAFEVSFGDQNQSIFKGVQLDQATLKNTSESFVVLENLGRTESGSSAYNVDIGLYEYYRQASYECEVTCMGNVMIQPTMFFYLKNIPMFKGTYWITEVSHSIKNNTINTTFKGSRMPYTSLPDPKDSFMSSFKALFDRLTQKAETRVNGVDRVTKTSEVVTTSDGSFTYDKGPIIVPNETVLQEAAFTKFGVPFNGFEGSRYIQKVKHTTGKWLRSTAVTIGGPSFPVDLKKRFSLIDELTDNFNQTINPKSLTWGDLTTTQKENGLFFITNFNTKKYSADRLLKTNSIFYNPVNSKGPITVNSKFELDVLTTNPRTIQGPVDIGPDVAEYGIALSKGLMKKLGIEKDGGVVYFWMGDRES